MLEAKKAEIDEVAALIATATADELTALRARFAVLITEYKALGGKINAEIAAINTVPDASGGGPNYTQTNPDGSRQTGRPAPGPITIDPNRGEILDVNGYTFRTTQTGRNFYHLQFYPSRFSDVQAWLAERNRPALGPLQNAQHGGIVLPRTGGTPVNVGEAGRAEAIIPLPDLAALAGNLMAGVGGGARLGGQHGRWLRRR